MIRLLLIVGLLPTLAWGQDMSDVYRALLGEGVTSTQAVVIASEPTDPQLAQAGAQLEATSTDAANVDCNAGHTYPLSETVRKLVSDVEAIVTDELMEEVDAPQSVVNKALAKSKDLVCAEMMMFAQTHNLKLDINCVVNPHKIPPVHFQVVKFPGLNQLREKIEQEIESLRLQLQQNPQNFSADSKLRSRTKDLNCLLENRIEDFSCRYLYEKHFSREKGYVQIELQDKSGQWYEFNRLPISYFSGGPGPKTMQGDRQVPESRFRLTSVNPASNYFSAVHIDYENWGARNALLGDLNQPGVNKGGDVKLHGNGGSIGCLDLGNRGSPWVSALVDMSLKGGKVPEIDIYPTDMESIDEVGQWPGFQKYDRFWDEVKKRYWDKHGASVRRDLKRVDEILEEIQTTR